jgi:alanine dehydrogenase
MQIISHHSITGIGSSSPLLSVKIVHLVDRADLFKVSNLVIRWKEILRSLYSSLQGQRVYGGYSELAGSLFVSFKIDGLGNFLEQLTL